MADPTQVIAVTAQASVKEAEDALSAVRGLDGVHDAAVVVRTGGGRLELHQTEEVAAGEGAVTGGAAGLVAGMLLGVPVVGALAGILGGGGLGLRDTGLPNAQLRRLGADLEPRQAILCVLVSKDGLLRLREALEPYGEVFETEVEGAAP
jgi:uncharacterized membrane protein